MTLTRFHSKQTAHVCYTSLHFLMLHARVASFSKMLQITLLSILVIPMGTTSYHPKNERASFHARLAKRARSFTTIATKRN